MQQQDHSDETIRISSNTVKLVSVLLPVAIAFAGSLFAFSNKADRQEIVKLRKYVVKQQKELKKRVRANEVGVATGKVDRNSILNGIREIKQDIKEIQKVLRENSRK